VWVVVGLGNPGARYGGTRHNVGFRVLDRLGERFGVPIVREAHHALMGEARRDGERVLLVKPQTFMNASGEAVGRLQRYYRLGAGQLIAVYDDVDLPVGRLRVRVGGGAGGHRGIESLIDALGDREFVRVRVGVGRPPAGCETVHHVLGELPPAEAGALAEAEARAADAVELVLVRGPAQAMNQFNHREATHGGPPL
jgi:PTH1 family peptidyl-tRNA hydrolase